MSKKERELREFANSLQAEILELADSAITRDLTDLAQLARSARKLFETELDLLKLDLKSLYN